MKAATYCRADGKGPEALAQQRAARVSGADRIDWQASRIEEYARARDITIVARYASASCDGTEPFAQRPAGERLLADAAAGLFDTVLVHSLDRIHPNLDDLYRAINLIVSRGLMLMSVTEVVNCPPPRYAREVHPTFRSPIEETAWANYWAIDDPATVDRMIELFAASEHSLPPRLLGSLAVELEMLGALKASGRTLAEWLSQTYPDVEGRSPSGGETVGKEDER